MKHDLSSRVGFLIHDVARLYGRKFDRLARETVGISRAQSRALIALAVHEGPQPLTQAALADELDMTPMGVATLCERMEAAGWIRREVSTSDRRAHAITAQPKADEALQAALQIGDVMQTQIDLTAAERRELVRLLQKMHARLK